MESKVIEYANGGSMQTKKYTSFVFAAAEFMFGMKMYIDSDDILNGVEATNGNRK